MQLSGHGVLVTATSKIGRPNGVRYAWSDHPHCNLYSGGGAQMPQGWLRAACADRA